MGNTKLVLLVGVAVSLSACGLADRMGASRAYNYATVLHSPEARGIGIGAQAPFRSSPLSIGVEAGGYKNVDDDTSSYALVHLEFDLIETRDRNPRVGGFIGFVSDSARADKFVDRYPVVGNFIPFVGFQATVPTVGPHEFRIRVSPGYSSQSAIFSIQSNFVF